MCAIRNGAKKRRGETLLASLSPRIPTLATRGVLLTRGFRCRRAWSRPVIELRCVPFPMEFELPEVVTASSFVSD